MKRFFAFVLSVLVLFTVEIAVAADDHIDSCNDPAATEVRYETKNRSQFYFCLVLNQGKSELAREHVKRILDIMKRDTVLQIPDLLKAGVKPEDLETTYKIDPSLEILYVKARTEEQKYSDLTIQYASYMKGMDVRAKKR